MMPSQTWNPEQYASNARFVADLGSPVVDLFAPKAGERVLDLGCGDGYLTKKLADIGCRVIGVDSSAEQIAAARALGLDARVMSAERLSFEREFDAVFSNAALHWVKQADAVIAGVRRSLILGGRFVAELGGYGCVQTIATELESALERRGIPGRDFNPWYFPTAEEYGEKLKRAGFEIDFIALIPRPTELPGDVTGWLETFARSFTAALAPPDRADYIAEVREALKPRLCNEKGVWVADYVRLRFAARST